MLQALNAEPGIRAAMVSEIPLSGDALDHDFAIEGRPGAVSGRRAVAYSSAA